jgi:hypothetical protein
MVQIIRDYVYQECLNFHVELQVAQQQAAY